MNHQLANLSTDLRRISNWMYEGRTDFVNNYISNIRSKYQINVQVGPYKDIWEEIKLIENNHGGNIKSADRATTLGSILLQESFKD